MKKITLIVALFYVFSLSGQQKIASHIQQMLDNRVVFRPVAPLIASGRQDKNIGNIVSNATLSVIDTDVTQDIFKKKYGALELAIPYNNSIITMQLYRVEVAAEGFHIDTDKDHSIPYNTGAYYRGIVKGNPDSVAAFSFFENELYGIVSAPGINNVVAGRVRKTGNITEYIVYSDKDMLVPLEFECMSADEAPSRGNTSQRSIGEAQSEHCVTMFFELQYNFFLNNGSDVTQTANWFTAIFNNVQALYENDGITTALKSIHIWTEPDPYTNDSPSSYGLLSQFADVRPVFDGDTGQVVMYGAGNGLAYLGGVCSDLNRSYSHITLAYADVPTYSWAVNVITHELGHLLGSQHTHGCYWNGNSTAIDGCGTAAGYIEGDCTPGPIPTAAEGGTIMSYCHMLGFSSINFANGFGPQPRQRIQDKIASSLCLGTDCINSCLNTVSAISLVDVTISTAILSWDDEGSGPWKIGYAPYGEAITNWQVTTQNMITLEGLDPNTYYTVGVSPVCSGSMAVGEKTITFNSGADWCAGAIWADTGGTDGDYSGSQHTISIIRPENGQSVSVTFNDFFTQVYDVINIYDGIGTNAPLIGTWSGYIAPSQPYVATNPSGALTFEFISLSQGFSSPGWAAAVTCSELGTKANTSGNLSYYPNPVNGKLTISSPDGIGSVKVYNVAGQLLTEKKADASTYVTDMSAYAPGIYIIKVSNGNGNTNLKILKQ